MLTAYFFCFNFPGSDYVFLGFSPGKLFFFGKFLLSSGNLLTFAFSPFCFFGQDIFGQGYPFLLSGEIVRMFSRLFSSGPRAGGNGVFCFLSDLVLLGQGDRRRKEGRVILDCCKPAVIAGFWKGHKGVAAAAAGPDPGHSPAIPAPEDAAAGVDIVNSNVKAEDLIAYRHPVCITLLVNQGDLPRFCDLEDGFVAGGE